MTESFTITRRGDFTVHVLGKNHCGTENPLDIKFTLAVQCSGASLDGRGFFFDQAKIVSVFEAIQSTHLSCEELAKDISRKIWRHIKRENPECDIQVFSLRLSPRPYAAELEFRVEETKETKEKEDSNVRTRSAGHLA